MLSVVMLNVVVLSVIMLNIVAPDALRSPQTNKLVTRVKFTTLPFLHSLRVGLES